MPQLKTVRAELASATKASHESCQAERDDAFKRGATPPECP